MRWMDRDGTPMPASAFLGIAEETGFMVPLGSWVLEEACREAATWHADLRVAVNVSSRHARRTDFAEEILAVLGATGLPPDIHGIPFRRQPDRGARKGQTVMPSPTPYALRDTAPRRALALRALPTKAASIVSATKD